MMKSGKYVNKEDSNDVLHLDLPRNTISLDCASGPIVSGEKPYDRWFVYPLLFNEDTQKWNGDVFYPENPPFQKVTIWSHDDQNTEVSVFYYNQGEDLDNGHAIKKTYKFETHAFRKVTFKYDRQSGVESVLSFNPAMHHDAYSYEAGVPNDELKIEDVFQKAGIKITVKDPTGVITVPERFGDAWNDGELNEIMDRSWPDRPELPLWSLWVFFASRHEGGKEIQGRMFDYKGKNQRQGTVLFCNSSIGVNHGGYGWQKDMERDKFWGICHEIGHAFNLGHVTDREAHVCWIPFNNDAEELSFMNFPETYGAWGFFKKFEYMFSKSELRFMRHAPDNLVRMGDAPWFDETSADQLNISRSPLGLHLRLDKPVFEYMEPVMMEVQLHNLTSEVQEVEKNALVNSPKLIVHVRRNGKERILHRNFIYDCFQSNKIKLSPMGTSHDLDKLKAPFFLSASKEGWIVTDPGVYEVQARYYLKEGFLESNILKFEVGESVGEMEKWSSKYFTDRIGRIMAFDGTIYHKDENDVLMEIVNRFKNSMAAVHSKITLSMPYAQDFKTFSEKEAKIVIEPADPEKAIKGLSWALYGDSQEERIKRQLSIGRKDYRYYQNRLRLLSQPK